MEGLKLLISNVIFFYEYELRADTYKELGSSLPGEAPT